MKLAMTINYSGDFKADVATGRRTSSGPGSISSGCRRPTRSTPSARSATSPPRRRRSNRHRHHQHVLAHGGRGGPDRGRLRLRQRRPLRARARRIRAAGRSRASTACRTTTRCRASSTTSTCAGWSWKREAPLEYEGPTVRCRCPPDQGTGLGKALKIINHPVRAEHPDLLGQRQWARAPTATPDADGWLPIFFDRRSQVTCGAPTCSAGLAERDPELGPMQMSAGGVVAIGDEYAGEGADADLGFIRPSYALYVGGMGARGQNFYNEDLRSATATRTRPPRSRTSTSPGSKRRPRQGPAA